MYLARGVAGVESWPSATPVKQLANRSAAIKASEAERLVMTVDSPRDLGCLVLGCPFSTLIFCWPYHRLKVHTQRKGSHHGVRLDHPVIQPRKYRTEPSTRIDCWDE